MVTACLDDPVFLRLCGAGRYIGRSLTNNIDQVFITMIFMMVLLYVFAVAGFYFNLAYAFEEHSSCAPDYDPGADDDARHCGGSLIDHFMLHVDYGVINPMVFIDTENRVSSGYGQVFNFLYYFLVNLVITAIVSGIIIDTFAEMRANRQAVAADLATSCFICSIEREDFEQFGVRYQEHISDDHNMWKYVWLMMHLREKDASLYTGLETHVAPLLMEHNNRALPLKKSRAISGKQVKERATLPTILGKVNALGNFSGGLGKAMDQVEAFDTIAVSISTFAPLTRVVSFPFRLWIAWVSSPQRSKRTALLCRRLLGARVERTRPGRAPARTNGATATKGAANGATVMAARRTRRIRRLSRRTRTRRKRRARQQRRSRGTRCSLSDGGSSGGESN